MTFDRRSGSYESQRKALRRFTPLPTRDLRRGGVAPVAEALVLGGGGAPTLTIAASDSFDTSKADLICDGTNDEYEVQAAADYLASTGGRIVLLEGSFAFASVVDLGSAAFHIEGVGHPTVTCTAGAFTSTGDAKYSGLQFTGGASGESIVTGVSANGLFIVEDCDFYSITAQVCVRPYHAGGSGDHLFIVRDNRFIDITISGGGGASPNGVIWADDGGAGGRYGLIIGNLFDNVSGSITDTNGGLYYLATGNTLRSSAGKREGSWFHNMIADVYTPGDHTGLTVAGSDSDAIHDNVAAEISAITEKATPVAADLVIIEDSAAANVKKKVQLGNIPADHGGLGGLTDDDHTQYLLAAGTRQATYLDVAGLTGATAASRYVGATASGAPASGTFAVGDYVIDQTGSVWVCTVAGSPGTFTEVGATAATDSDAIHDNVANEISAITEKTTPADADLVIIEDSAASYVKKKVQVSNLPGGGSVSWTAFSPTWETLAGTSLSAGTGGTNAGRYAYNGANTLYVYINVTLGTSPTLGSGNDYWTFKIPDSNTVSAQQYGSAWALDSGTAHRIGTVIAGLSASDELLIVSHSGAWPWKHDTPHTWVNTDTFGCSILLEVD